MMQFVAVFLSSLFICSNALAGTVSPDAISAALNERMQIMKAVAGYKARHHLPVEDLPREQVVLDKMLRNAQQTGLEPQSVTPFIHALMNASKAIQYRYLADWLATPENARAPADLAETRQQIERLDTELLTAIGQRLTAGPLTASDSHRLIAALAAPHLSEADKASLVASLTRIQRKA
ncbi:chorismate mutase [Pantoea sp.]|uniref:chorismate mutase n=1 Tax=Pantoea sp. TaxID=69393 RepID=UPI0028A74305|nr:chorismate mutase [Pantoea sp.]